MATSAQAGFMELEAEESLKTGLFPSQILRTAIHQSREIEAIEGIRDDQVQPASLDLRLGRIGYQVPASFLPGPDRVQEKAERFAMRRFDLSEGAVLERGGIYVVELMERLALRKRTSALANPKSSIGRLDVLVRLVTDYGREFNRVPERYHGPLFAEIAPRAFSIRVRRGSRLNQIRLKRGSPPTTDTQMRRLDKEIGLLDIALRPEEVRNGIPLTVNVIEGKDGIIGYKAKKTAGLIDVDRVGVYPVEDFWEPVRPFRKGGLILDKGDFYILASKEAVRVPTHYAAELVAYDTLVGEFRVHYAGFFDPGFGAREAHGEGSRAVLEVRSYEVPFLIEDGQVVGRLNYERLIAEPDRLYGSAIGSSYQKQGLALSKHFRVPN